MHTHRTDLSNRYHPAIQKRNKDMDKTNQPSSANKASSQRNSAAWRARTIVTMLAVATTLVFTSCDDFIFGNVNINYNDNPLEAKPIPHSGADKYVDSLKKLRTTQPMRSE